MTPMVEPSPYCATCRNTRTVPHWQPHDGRDYPDKRGWLERRMVACPDCTKRT